MFQVQVEVENALHGAAYQVLYEKVSPANCLTRERQEEIKAEFVSVNDWAAQQSPEVQNAYKWATECILKQIEASLKSNELGRDVQETLKTFPKPP